MIDPVTYWRSRAENKDAQVKALKRGARIEKRQLTIARGELRAIADAGGAFSKRASTALDAMREARSL